MDNKEYKVSIILPVHNGEKYLSSAIESIITQTYENIELIIIDDFSSDHSNKIAKSYAQKDSRVRVYRNKENKKLPRSLNAGFKMATGEFFTWTSDDNLLKPETIQTLVEVFQKKPDVDFVYADIIPIDENGRVKKMSYLNGEVEDIYVFNPVLACFMYRRKVHETLKGYNPNKFLYEDYDFWLRTYENGFNMYHLKRKLYFYRFHTESLTSKKKNECSKIQIKIYKKNLLLAASKKTKLEIYKKLEKLYDEQKDKVNYYKIKIRRKIYEVIGIEKINKSEQILIQSKKSFDTYAKTYEKEDWFEEPYKCYQPTIDIIKNEKKEKYILDIGCGTGIVLERINNEFDNVKKLTGVDISGRMLEEARKRLDQSDCDLIEGTLETSNLLKNSYNIALCMHSFHHYPHPFKTLRLVNSILKEEGCFIIADNKKVGYSRWKYNYQLRKNGYMNGDFWIYSKVELVILGLLSGFKIESYQNIGTKSFIMVLRK